VFKETPMSSTEQLVEDGAVDVTEASKFTGLGRTFLYSLMDAGRLKYVKLGKRRLIPRAELRRLLAESVVPGSDK
jgi:excisionase family DNA binding protein